MALEGLGSQDLGGRGARLEAGGSLELGLSQSAVELISRDRLGSSLQGGNGSLGSLSDLLVASLGVDTEETGIGVAIVEGRDLGTVANLGSGNGQGGDTRGGPLDETVTTEKGAEDLGGVELGSTGSGTLESDGNMADGAGVGNADITTVVLGTLGRGSRASSDVAEGRVSQALELSLADTGGNESDLVGNKVVGSELLQVLGGDVRVSGGVDRVAETVAESSAVKGINDGDLGSGLGQVALGSDLGGNRVELVLSELGLGNEVTEDLDEVWAISIVNY